MARNVGGNPTGRRDRVDARVATASTRVASSFDSSFASPVASRVERVETVASPVATSSTHSLGIDFRSRRRVDARERRCVIDDASMDAVVMRR